jgi:hypothetical protein
MMHIGIGLVGDYQRDFHIITLAKVAGNIFGIAAATRCKKGESNHKKRSIIAQMKYFCAFFSNLIDNCLHN